MARAATRFIRGTKDDLLYNDSRRVGFWGSLTSELLLRHVEHSNSSAFTRRLKSFHFRGRRNCRKYH
jgi:hypothetical protein